MAYCPLPAMDITALEDETLRTLTDSVTYRLPAPSSESLADMRVSPQTRHRRHCHARPLFLG
jgi:hypothetical protein